MLGFAANKTGKLSRLCGIKVTYLNGRELAHNEYTTETEAWATEMNRLLSVVRFTAGRLHADQLVVIKAVEFVSCEEGSDNLLPDWPMNLKSDQFEGLDDEDKLLDFRELVELVQYKLW